MLEDRPRVLDVLDRLQEDDRVAGLGEALDQVPLEAQVRPHVAQPGVLVGLGVGVDADHSRRSALRHQVRPVPLAAGHVDDPPAGHLPGDPLVDDQMAPVPVVLLRHVGQRPLAGQRQRRHAIGLVFLQVLGRLTRHRSEFAFCSGMPNKKRPRRWGAMVASIRVEFRRDASLADSYAGPHQGRQHPLPRRGGRRVRRQVGDRLRRDRPGAGAPEAGQGARPARPGRIRGRARDRLRNRLLLAQPAAARGDRAPHRDRHLAGDARAPLDNRRGPRPGGGDGRHRGRGDALRRRELRPRLRSRRPPSHSRPRPRLLRIPTRAAARRRDRLLR